MARLISHPERVPLLVLGMVALAAGLWSGLARLGWNVAVPRPDWVMLHGPLMVSGFLGTLIALERAVALGRGWGYAVPLGIGLGTVAMLANAPTLWAPLLWLGGGLGLVAIFIALALRQFAWHIVIMACGALLWSIGTFLWLRGQPVFQIVFWWAAFLAITIAGERLELSRFRQLPFSIEALLMAAMAVVAAGLIVALQWPDVGVRLVGGGLLGMAWWLMQYDIARRTIAQAGLTRFMAVALLGGYAWLAISGIAALWFGPVTGGPDYDLVLHTFFFGFVFAMIFAHAPVIFPAVLGVRMDYHARLYAHVLLLHVGLLLRVVSDLAGWGDGRHVAGLLNVLTIGLFVVNMASTVRAAAVRRESVAK